MTIYWPETLPRPIFGAEITLADPQWRGDENGGYALYERRFTGVPETFSAVFRMRAEQAVAFESFYKNDTADGSLWFAMALKTPHATRDYYVRLAGPYSFEKIGPTVWEYRVPMEIYLRPGSYALPPMEELEP